MSKRWLGLVVILASWGWSATAWATLSTSVNPVAVGNVVVLQTGTTAPVTISSDGSDNLKDFSFSNAANCAPFTITPLTTLPQTVDAGNQVDITVTFAPLVRGASAPCTVTMRSPSNAALGTFTVSGTGVAPIVSVPATQAFGSVRAASGTASRTIVVANTTTDPGQNLVVSSYAFGGTNPGDFTITNTPLTTIPPGMSTNVIVRFDPAALDARSATLVVSSNDPLAPTATTTLSGTGTAALIAVTDHNFDIVPITTTVTSTITVSNLGGTPQDPLHVTSAAITGGAGWFTFDANGTSGCLNQASCTFAGGGFDVPPDTTIGVRCRPPAGASGVQTATVTITSNSDAGGDNTSTLTCTAGRADLTPVAPLVGPFGNIEVGKVSAAQTLTVKNTGNLDLTITDAGFTSGGLDYTAFVGPLGPQTTTLTPGMTATWDIVCNPSTHGTRNGSFRIVSTATVTNTNTALSCTGEQGVLAIGPPTSIDFGGVAVGGNKPLTFTLRNTGNVAVTGIAAVVDPTTTGYSLDPGTPTTLAGGASVVLTARFRPMAETDGGPATITFAGGWGVTPTNTSAVLNLNGDGLLGGFNVTQATIDFGNLRFDTTPTRTFCIVNTDQAPLQIQGSLAIVPAAGTMTGEFAVTTIKRQAVCGTGGTVVTTLPQALAPGELLEVTVRADPANRVGPMAATLTVTSDLPMNPTRTVNLLGNSTAAMLAVSPGATLDFGTVDVQGPAVTKALTITNTGDGALDLTGFARTADPQFTFTLPPNTTLPPAQVLTIMVTYKPVVAAPVGSEERVTLNHSIAGVLNGPATGTIIIQGRGIDRDLDLGPTPVFPDTFRNPGDLAPIRPVTVRNIGEAVLKLSAVMFTTSDDSWQIVDPAPVDVPPMGTYEIKIRFSPTRSTSTSAILQIFNDDDANPIVNVNLTGNGRDRNVTFGPDIIRLGYTGVGVPVTIPDALLVQSTDPMNPYTIRSIAVEQGAPFTIEGTTEDLELMPRATRTFAVTFAPEAQGTFQATVSLFLDGDQLTHHDVVLEGQAVFVDAHGGGGCSSGHDLDGLGGGALVLIAVLALRRRRQIPGALAAVTVVTLAAMIVPAARADNVVLSVFDPTPATTSNGFQLQSPEVGANGDWVASAVVSYATDPLVLAGIDNGQLVNDTGVIRRSTLVDVGLAYAFLDRFEAGVRLPLYTQAGDALGDSRTMFTTEPASGTARGDLTIHGKARLWRRGLEGNGAIYIGASFGLTLPTASDGQFTGVDQPSLRALLLGSLMPGAFANRITLSMNAGGVIRAKSTYANLEQKSGIAWGLGVSVRALDRVWLAGEVFGDMVPAGRVDEMGGSLTLSPIEWLAGLRWKPDHRFTIGLAGGRGLTSAVGTPALRGVVSLTVSPGAAEIRPIHEPRPPTQEGDGDGDGVLDSADKCPGEPEDADMFDDADGCPDPDNDHDGLADASDRCPIDAEDKDGFEDADGCPDTDNDSDGLPDDKDRCPMEAEDKDGFDDTDGCPDPDNDHDGVPDDRDRCPKEAETINGNKDDDGCPDKGDSMVMLSPDRLETLAGIQFNGAKITNGSFNLLGQIGWTMRAHPEIVRLRVTSHVQPTSQPDRDQELSNKRAQAVRDWLVQWGVEPNRVDVRGFGGTKPIAPPDQRGSATLNERIELIILERK